MGKIHMGPPPPPPPQRVGQTDRQTNTYENITFPHYVAGGNNNDVVKSTEYYDV